MSGRRFVLLDRDGTVIVERFHLSDPDMVELLPSAAEGLRRMCGLGLGLIVVTNQAGIGKRLFSIDRLKEIHTRMNDLLAEEGITLDGIYWCPHTAEDGCACRKPLPGLIEQASREWGFDPAQSFVVGDKACDVDLGRNVGATTFLVRTGYGAEIAGSGNVAAEYVVDDLIEASRIIDHLIFRSQKDGDR